MPTPPENKPCIAVCLKCRSRFNAEELANAACCPKCGTKSKPLDPAMEAKVGLNTQELRILCMWAENYAATIDAQNLDNPGYENLVDVVKSIVTKLDGDLKAQDKWVPLTIGAELEQIREKFPGSDPKFFRGGHEQL